MQATALTITLEKVKVHKDMSQETNCFSATICLDGRPVGEVSNEGTGGPHRFGWRDRDAGKQIEEWANAQPLEFEFEKIGQIIDRLLAEHEEAAQLKRWCKKKTVFRLHGDEAGAWRTVNAPFDAKVKAFIVGKYGDKIERIANEG